MNEPYHIVIPARLASQRLPNKPLLEIAGRTLIEHVYRKACLSNAESVIIATDSAEVFELASGFGATAVMTSSDHQSGSDRIAECIGALEWSADTVVVNLQGDEPLMPPICLDQVAELLQRSPTADVASLFLPITDTSELDDSNVVKVVTTQSGRAMYFSRSMIPYPRGLTPAISPANCTWGSSWIEPRRSFRLAWTVRRISSASERLLQPWIELYTWVRSANRHSTVKKWPPGCPHGRVST